jgi:hypothetical protein
MTDPIPLQCPYCGEAVELDVDEGGGPRQRFVQDCPVCCRPWEVDLTCNRTGDWSAILRTGNE